MIYNAGINGKENKTVTYYPVFVVEFNQYKCVYYIERNIQCFVFNYFFAQDCKADNILCAHSAGEALAFIGEFKSDPNSERLINNFVKAVKSYNNPCPSPNAPQYLNHYFSIIRRECIITTSLMDDKYHTSPKTFKEF